MIERSPGPSYQQTLESTVLSNGYLVSTIRLQDTIRSMDGLISTLALFVEDNDRADLSTPGDFETMVFPFADGEVTNWTELDFRRYTTEEEARAGHEEVVQSWMRRPPSFVYATTT